MSYVSTLRTGIFTISAVLALSLPAVHAEPVSIGGSLRSSPTDSGSLRWATLFFGGDMFLGEMPRPLTPGEELCTPCSPGQVLDLSTTFTLAADGLWFTSPDEPGRPAFGEGQLTFAGTPVTVPVRTAGGGFELTFPLAATGFLRFVDAETSNVLFENSVFGTGVGGLLLTGPNSAVPYSFAAFRYDLADPVPEPTSIVLTGTGVLWLARHARNRRRTRAQRRLAVG